jgi:hypothetical protein
MSDTRRHRITANAMPSRAESGIPTLATAGPKTVLCESPNIVMLSKVAEPQSGSLKVGARAE